MRDTPTGRYRGTTRELDLGARQLRQTMTPAERRLWQALRRHQLDGLHFRRQHPVGLFVLAFYCAAHKLVIEVDGGLHDEQVEQDTYQTQHLNASGYRVLRFRNEEVLTDLSFVLARIAAAATSPSLAVGGGVGEGAAN
jgi:very-short-patch-repair endonuclease